jgi:hypothetical protein
METVSGKGEGIIDDAADVDIDILRPHRRLALCYRDGLPSCFP